MKKKGAVCDYRDERDAAVLAAYRDEVAKASRIMMDEIVRIVSARPSHRFWVSEERAELVVRSMMKGMDALDGMRDTKRRMYEEIYRRVSRMREEKRGISLNHIIFEVVNSPAPEFYLTPRYVRDIVYRTLPPNAPRLKRAQTVKSNTPRRYDR